MIDLFDCMFLIVCTEVGLSDINFICAFGTFKIAFRNYFEFLNIDMVVHFLKINTLLCEYCRERLLNLNDFSFRCTFIISKTSYP